MTVKGDFEVIAKGAFADGGCICETYTVRLSPALTTEWSMAWNVWIKDGTEGNSKLLEEFVAKICDKVIGTAEGVTLSPCVSEIFTITHIYKVPKFDEDGQEVEE